MSASGKSSNRAYEEHRGYSTGGGHGIYAADGDRRYKNKQARLHQEGKAHNKRRCNICLGKA